jgi:hypothetical protein
LNVTVGFLSEAPPGEFDDWLAALMKFVNDQQIAPPAWMKEHSLPMDVEGAKVIICEEALLENGLLLDPTSMRPFRYDFETRTVARVLAETRRSSPLRDTMQGTVQKFASTSMRNDNCTIFDNRRLSYNRHIRVINLEGELPHGDSHHALQILEGTERQREHPPDLPSRSRCR